MDAQKEKEKIEQVSKDLYVRQKELDSQLKDFDSQKENLDKIKKDLQQKQREMAQLTADFKAKNKLLKDVQGKLDELDGAQKMAELIEQLKGEVSQLKNDAKNKGASSQDLEIGKSS